MQWKNEPFDDGRENAVNEILTASPKYTTEPYDDGKEATIKIKIPVTNFNTPAFDDGQD